jgi:hypothetical protein
MEPVSAQTSLPVRGIIWDILLNASIPVLLYQLSKHYVSPSEIKALAIATTFPLGKSIFELVRRGQVDPVSILVLLGIVTNGVALLLGGSPRVLLIRESFFTGAFGVACFISLWLPRPLMFYFGRYFMAGNDPERQARFDATWQLPAVRFSHRLITSVWGIAYVGELMIRMILIYNASPSTVLVLSPILMGTVTIGTIIWTFRYAHQVRSRTPTERDTVTSPSAV